MDVLEPAAVREAVPQVVAAFARGVLGAGTASKMAAIASRLPAASRSISSRTSFARRWMCGSVRAWSIQASMARRTSSVTVRSLSWAIMSSWVRVDSLSLTARGLIGP
ncbi:hypothetical protein HR12_08370 [Microbacterium sp. SUBG005]|nr:hypothetical protein HR12_08370 [Microbacterium sp. SUBG005]